MSKMDLREKSTAPRWRLVFCVTLATGVLISFLFPDLWSLWLGPLHYSDHYGWLYPFLDMQGRIAAFEGHRAGIDMLYQRNPFDPMGRLNVKPSWPLHLSFLGIGRPHLVPLSFAVIIATLGVFMHLVRPKNFIELALAFFICFSPPILLGIERANDDLLYFCLLAILPALFSRKRAWGKWCAWIWILLLTPAKFYPGAAFALLLFEERERTRLAMMLGMAAAFLALHTGLNIEELQRIREIVPRPDSYMSHGLPALAEALGNPLRIKGIFILAVGLLSLLIIVKKDVQLGDACPKNEARWFILGASIWFFCFVVNSNFDYRLVYFIFMLPLLLSLSRSASSTVTTLLGRTTLLLLIPAFWCDIFWLHMLRSPDGFWQYDALATVNIIKNITFAVLALFICMLSAHILKPNLRHLLNLK
ncbi:MAG: hypothetical protein ACPG3X_02280 [Opitutales bacterium]